MNESTGRDAYQYPLRLPDSIRDRLKIEADANRRSLNAEIVARLEASFNSSSLPSDVVKAINDHIAARVAELEDQ